MNSFERWFINYKPILGYKPDIGWIRQETGSSVEDLNEKLPSELKDANSILASEVLEGALEAMQNLENAIGKIEECLNNKKLNGPVPFSNYQQALEEGNMDVIAAFDDFHRSSIEGSAQAEIYPALLYVHEELEGYVKRLGNTFFGKADIKQAEIEHLKEDEKEALNSRTANAIKDPDSIDYDRLSIEAKTKLQTKDRVEGLQNFVQEAIEVVSSTINERFGGNVRAAVSVMATAPLGHMNRIKKTTEARMAIAGGESQAIHTRFKGLGNNVLRDKLDGAVVELTKSFLDTRNLQSWLMDVVENDPEQAMFELVECSLYGMEEVKHNLDKTLEDAMKMNKLDEMNRSDLLSNISTKKVTRQIYKLASNIEKHLDPDDLNVDRQVDRLVANLELEKSPDICSE